MSTAVPTNRMVTVDEHPFIAEVATVIATDVVRPRPGSGRLYVSLALAMGPVARTNLLISARQIDSILAVMALLGVESLEDAVGREVLALFSELGGDRLMGIADTDARAAVIIP